MKLYMFLFFLLTVKYKINREKFLQIFYTKTIYSIRCHFVQSLRSEILLPVVFYKNITYSFRNSRNSIIDSRRDPATQKRNLLTWFSRRCHIRFRSQHILPAKLFFFFRVALSSPIDGKSVDLCRCVEILFYGFIREILKATIFESDSREVLLVLLENPYHERTYL